MPGLTLILSNKCSQKVRDKPSSPPPSFLLPLLYVCTATCNTWNFAMWGILILKADNLSLSCALPHLKVARRVIGMVRYVNRFYRESFQSIFRDNLAMIISLQVG